MTETYHVTYCMRLTSSGGTWITSCFIVIRGGTGVDHGQDRKTDPDTNNFVSSRAPSLAYFPY
jgi:hypothetical protein